MFLTLYKVCSDKKKISYTQQRLDLNSVNIKYWTDYSTSKTLSFSNKSALFHYGIQELNSGHQACVVDTFAQ